MNRTEPEPELRFDEPNPNLTRSSVQFGSIGTLDDMSEKINKKQGGFYINDRHKKSTNYHYYYCERKIFNKNFWFYYYTINKINTIYHVVKIFFLK